MSRETAERIALSFIMIIFLILVIGAFYAFGRYGVLEGCAVFITATYWGKVWIADGGI